MWYHCVFLFKCRRNRFLECGGIMLEKEKGRKKMIYILSDKETRLVIKRWFQYCHQLCWAQSKAPSLWLEPSPVRWWREFEELDVGLRWNLNPVPLRQRGWSKGLWGNIWTKSRREDQKLLSSWCIHKVRGGEESRSSILPNALYLINSSIGNCKHFSLQW